METWGILIKKGVEVPPLSRPAIAGLGAPPSVGGELLVL
jgi:hypothetical protein